MTAKRRIVSCGELDASLSAYLRERYEIVQAADHVQALSIMQANDALACIHGVHAAQAGSDSASGSAAACGPDPWPACTRILDDLPDGIAMIDREKRIRWSNQTFRALCQDQPVEGQGLYSVLPELVIMGPDFCPCNTTLATGRASSTTARVAGNQYYQLHASHLHGQGSNRELVVVIRDITAQVHQQQKLEAIHQAGITLTDLLPRELTELSVEDRIALLKSNILHYARDVLDFSVVEIRLLEESTGRLVPLLSEGMSDEASQRPLFAKPQGYGVTGFTAATGKSYLCEDTQDDPLYLPGLPGARSSLTVPLLLHNTVIGTFNVEKAEPHGFTPDDLMFLEIFARAVAVALNTLELLTAQGVNEAKRSVEAIHRVLARPIDAILNDTVHVLETYIGHDPEIGERLRRILREVREIRQLIQEVGKSMAPAEGVPVFETEGVGRLQDVRVLVVDAHDEILDSAHLTLEHYGCIVETTKTGGQAVFMVRANSREMPYDVVIAEVGLPDMSGHDLFQHLKPFFGEKVPLGLMQGFGHDPGHAIVKARQAGLHPKAVLYKPFRVDQLLDVIETIIDWRRE